MPDVTYLTLPIWSFAGDAEIFIMMARISYPNFVMLSFVALPDVRFVPLALDVGEPDGSLSTTKSRYYFRLVVWQIHVLAKHFAGRLINIVVTHCAPALVVLVFNSPFDGHRSIIQLELGYVCNPIIAICIINVGLAATIDKLEGVSAPGAGIGRCTFQTILLALLALSI